MPPRQDHLHWELNAGPRDTLQITIDQSANVLLMDDANYQQYCKGQGHTCYGGPAEKGTVTLKAMRPGRWHIVVDKGRAGGVVTASVKNSATGQPVGTAQGRSLTGAQAGTLEFRPDKE